LDDFVKFTWITDIDDCTGKMVVAVYGGNSLFGFRFDDDSCFFARPEEGIDMGVRPSLFDQCMSGLISEDEYRRLRAEEDRVNRERAERDDRVLYERLKARFEPGGSAP
jgi:hypothetical protein